ncbi:hypothetical protein DOK78_002026 [Enterococcus sp. DIV2402]|uniref:Alcohol dehydrogenase-like N-terminal domain-containing protein n=1 Tax=Candidatus Enterococcus lowellii TaxID=2230877 RepID=A0ABZ2SPC2_9ENTE|nr:alcohol dehydrogenase catalytic domain-containing protein [Enterococcus sp. DIV2402]MBO0463847.1 alcohol dehydrogenase catalytic domain-containing protein [Enterococcus sp. DIV2402]
MKNKSKLISISVEKVGVCGSDKQKILQNSLSVKYLGHEIIGIDNSLKKYVAVNPNIHCGTCFYCRRKEFNLCSNVKAIGNNIEGGLKGTLQIPIDNLLYLESNNVKYTLLDPLAVIIHGLSLINIKEEDSVLIIGNGTLAKILIWILNKKNITPSLVNRRGCIENPKGTLKTNETYKYTKVISKKFKYTFEIVGYEQVDSIETAISNTQKNGYIVCFGVFPKGYYAPIELRSLFENEIKIQGVRSFNPKDFKIAKKILDDTHDEILDVINIKHTKFVSYEQLLIESKIKNVDKLIVDLK